MNCSFSPQISDSKAEPPAAKWPTTVQSRFAKLITPPTSVPANRPTMFSPTRISGAPGLNIRPAMILTFLRT